jgi:hypothetical protein
MNHGKGTKIKKGWFRKSDIQMRKQDNLVEFIFGKPKKQWKKKYEQCIESNQ